MLKNELTHYLFSLCIIAIRDLHNPCKTDIADLRRCQLRTSAMEWTRAFIHTRTNIVETEDQGRHCRIVRGLVVSESLLLCYPNIVYLRKFSASKQMWRGK